MTVTRGDEKKPLFKFFTLKGPLKGKNSKNAVFSSPFVTKSKIEVNHDRYNLSLDIFEVNRED